MWLPTEMEVMPLPTPSKPDQPEMQRGLRADQPARGVTSSSSSSSEPESLNLNPRSVIVGFGFEPIACSRIRGAASPDITWK